MRVISLRASTGQARHHREARPSWWLQAPSSTLGRLQGPGVQTIKPHRRPAPPMGRCRHWRPGVASAAMCDHWHAALDMGIDAAGRVSRPLAGHAEGGPACHGDPAGSHQACASPEAQEEVPPGVFKGTNVIGSGRGAVPGAQAHGPWRHKGAAAAELTASIPR